MTQRTFALTILLLVTVLSRHLPWLGVLSFMPRKQALLPQPVDAESLLASGQPISLICADTYSLELIPGISDRTAAEIQHQRYLILDASRDRPFEESLKLARGIGDKTASRIARYLSESGGCEANERYAPFSPAMR